MRMCLVVPGVVLAVGLTVCGQAGATTVQFGGANVSPSDGCSGAGGTTFVQVKSQPGLSYAAPFSGVITSWSFVSDATVLSPVKLKIFRPTAVPTDFTVVGESAPFTPLPNLLTVVPTSIRVAAGDLLGLRSTTGAMTHCAVTTWSFDDLMRGSDTADPAPGTLASIALGFDRRRLTVGATIETDVDGDGLGDDTQDGDDDGDGRGDAADNCPTVANPAQGNADRTGPGDACDERPTVGAKTKIKRASFLKGVRVTATPDQPAALEFELLGSARGATIARTFNLVLARRVLPLAAGKRGVRLKPKKQLVGHRRRFAAQLRITATDASGNRAVVTKTLRVR
jgi:thrombospondin type 3 repeat protein